MFDEFCKGAIKTEMKRVRIGFAPFKRTSPD